jgi:chromosome segregation ATPase
MLKLAEPCSPKLKACVDDLIAQGREESSAWAICRSQLGESYGISDFIMPPGPVAELVKPALDKINDMIAEQRKSFKRDQDIAQKVNEVISFLPTYWEQIGTIAKQMSEGLKTEIQGIHEKMQAIPKDDLSWKQLFEQLPKDDTSWKDLMTNLPQDDLSWKESIANLPKDDVSWKEENKALKDSMDNQFKEIAAKVDEKLKEFDKVLGIADTNFAKVETESKQKDEKIAELEQKLKEKDEKQVKETSEKDTKIKELEEQLENVKPNFKGKTKGVTANQNAPLMKDPMKGD